MVTSEKCRFRRFISALTKHARASKIHRMKRQKKSKFGLEKIIWGLVSSLWPINGPRNRQNRHHEQQHMPKNGVLKMAIYSKNLTPNPIQKPLFRAIQPILRSFTIKSHTTRCQIFRENDHFKITQKSLNHLTILSGLLPTQTIRSSIDLNPFINIRLIL